MKNKRRECKRAVAMLLAALMVVNSVDLSAFTAYAAQSENVPERTEQSESSNVMTITGFEGLEADVMEQQLPVGASEEEIVFPDTLNVTVSISGTQEETDTTDNEESVSENTDTVSGNAVSESEESDVTGSKSDENASETVQTPEAESETGEGKSENPETEGSNTTDTNKNISENEETNDTDTDNTETDNTETASILSTVFSAFAPMTVYAAEEQGTQDGEETQTKKITLTDITWEIDAAESDGEAFDSCKDCDGYCYVYVPVLPETDADGNAVVLGEAVETPVIYVLIGESDHVSAIAEEGYTAEGFCKGYSWVDGSLTKNSEDDIPCSHGDTCNGYQPAEETPYDVDGNGTTADDEKAYKITNAGQLYWFANYVNQGGDNLKANAYLANDITINENLLSRITTDEETGEVTNDEEFRKWVPIGDRATNSDLKYAGVFDGNNHSIQGIFDYLFISTENQSMSKGMYHGFFGWLKGSVKALGIKDSVIMASHIVGGIAGCNHGTIEGCTFDGKVISTAKTKDLSSYVGGIAGMNAAQGVIKKTINSAEVVGYIENIGGIAGSNISEIEDSVNEGKVINYYSYVSSDKGATGGIVGYNESSSDYRGIVEKCVNQGDILGYDAETTGVNCPYVGGIVGVNNGGLIKECFNCCDIDTESVNHKGGICYMNKSYSSTKVGEILNCGDVGITDSGYGICYYTNYSEGAYVKNCYTSSSKVAYFDSHINDVDAGYANVYYLSVDEDGNANETDKSSGTTAMTAADFASGKVAYLLNQAQEDNKTVWYQNIDNDGTKDSYPVLDSTHGIVYASQPCHINFSNDQNSLEAVEHIIIQSTEDSTKHICTQCKEIMEHTPIFTADNENHTISGKCSECQAECGTFTLDAPADDILTYDGTAKEASVSGTVSGVTDTPTITYAKLDESGTETVLTGGAKPTDAGEYKASITCGTGEGAVTVSVTYTIAQAAPTITWSKANETAYYTGNAVSSDDISIFLKVTGASDTDITNDYDTADYTFSYRKSDSTGAFTNGLPTALGEYQIKAEVTAKGNYKEAETADYLTLKVDWFDSVLDADLHDQNDNDVSSGTEYWAQSITFTAPTGFTISQELEGTYADSFTYQEETGKDGTAVTYYLKEDGSGRIVRKTATVYIDRTAPTFPDVGNYGINIQENWFKRLLNTITFGRAYKNNVEVKVLAKEELSGVEEYYYYIDDSGLETVKTAEQLDQLRKKGEFKSADASGSNAVIVKTLGKGEEIWKYVVYAYAVDKAGNKSDYICSNGVVVDDTKPTITLTAPTEDAGTLTDNSAAITLTASEAGTYFYVLKKDGEAVPSAMTDFADSATDNGKTIWTAKTGIESASMVEGDNTITLSGLEPNTDYTLYVMAADSVGNTAASVGSKAFTTLKQMPTITVKPQITGTYGQKLSEMTVTGGTATVAGTWEIKEADADSIYPTVNGTTKYTVEFQPTDDKYATVMVDVIPTVAKKSVTVAAADKTKKYGEVNPELTFTAPDGTLVGSDSKADLGVILSCVAGQYSDVKAGGYAITGTSDSANYDVTVTQGTLTIEKADAQINIPKSSYEVTYGDAPFNLDITGTNLDKDVEYEVTVGADSIVVSGDGTVTIRSAKTANATIKVTLSASTNYNAAPEQTITITVAKKTYGTGSDDITKKYLHSRDNADTIDISALLPRDCGDVTYSVYDKEGAYNTDPEVDTDGNLTYTVASGNISDTGKIVVKAETDNYTDITITVNWQLTDKLPVVLKEGSSVTLKNRVLTYGDALSKLKFNTAVFVAQDDPTKVITGTLAWTNPDSTPDAGTTSAEWTFTPDASYNGEYGTVTDDANITVRKATPTVETAPAVNMTYNPSTKLSDINLNTAGTTVTAGTVKGAGGIILAGTWSWKVSSQIPQVNNNGYVATFTPANKTNYESVTRTITVTVAKATPYIDSSTLTASGLTYGQTLADSTLHGSAYYDGTKGTSVAGSFEWKNKSFVPAVSDSNTTSYVVIFKPTDSTNYNETEITTTVTVAKAAYPSDKPSDTMSVANSCKTVGAVELPGAWVWAAGEAAKTLTVGEPLTATAVYNGTDKDNYETVSVDITITRSACDHVAGEILYTGTGEHAPDCENTGLGHRECTKCHEVTESSIVVAALGHQGGTATCTKKAVCTVCQQEYGSTNPDNHTATEVRGHRDADCTSAGYTGDTYCKDCGTRTKVGTTIAALGHNYKSEVTKQPTTTSTGVRTYTCERCGDSYTETIAKLPEEAHNHSYTGTVTRQADCTNAGVKTYTCSCGDSYTESIPALGHNYISRVTKEATTTAEGVMTYTCERCGHSYTRPIAKLESNTPDNNKPGSNEPDNNKPSNDNKPDDNGKSDTGKPYIEGKADKNGWENIKDQLKEAKEKDTVTVDMNGTTVVPGDVFDTVKGKDVTVVFNMGDGITWTVNGKDITADKVGDIDFGVQKGGEAGKTIPVELINNVTGERYSMNVTLAYDGEFGFKATLSLNVGKENAGLYANLFYYNPETNSLEYMSAGVIDDEGNAHLDFTHASDYTIVVDTEDMKNTDTGSASDVSSVPGTADGNDAWNPWWIIVIGAVILIVGIGVFFLAKKKRETEESDN